MTYGHLDIIERAAGLFDRIVVGVVRHPTHKEPFFTIEERMRLLQEVLSPFPNVVVAGFSTLVVEYARAWGACALVKGLRAVSDFEWELQMAHLNKRIAPEIETVFLMSSPSHSFLSSSGVRELAAFGGPIADFVPPVVAERLREAHGLGGPMDVLVLIDKLDELVHDAKAVPLTDQVRIDREEIWEILDQMRATIPEEIKQARWIVKERQEMLAEAKREAERLVAEARERAAELASQQEDRPPGRGAGPSLLGEARRREREVRLGAEDYADEILATLEVNLGKFLTAVQRGREQLQRRSDEPSALELDE